MANYGGNISATGWQTGLLDELKTAADAESGWTTVVNQYDDGTYIRSVFKCDYQTDFYVVVFTVTGPVSGTTSVIHSPLLVTVCEDYDAATHKLKRPAVWVVSNVSSASDQSASLSWLTLADVITNYGVANFIATSTAITQTTITWRIIITAETFYFAQHFPSLANPPRGFISVGFANSLVKQASTNDPVPLVAILGVNATGGLPTADNQRVFIPTANTSNFCNGNIPLTTGTVFGTIAASTRSPLSSGKGGHNWRLTGWSLTNGDYQQLVLMTGDAYSESGGTYLSPTLLWRADSTSQTTFGLTRATADFHAFGWNNNGVAAGDVVNAGTKSYYCVAAGGTNTSFRARWIRSA